MSVLLLVTLVTRSTLLCSPGQQLHDADAGGGGGAVPAGGVPAGHPPHHHDHLQHLRDPHPRGAHLPHALPLLQLLHPAQLPAELLHLLRHEQAVPRDVQEVVHWHSHAHGEGVLPVHDPSHGERQDGRHG